MSDAATGLFNVHAFRATVVERSHATLAEWHQAGLGHVVLVWRDSAGRQWRGELDQKAMELSGTARLLSDSGTVTELRELQLRRIACVSIPSAGAF
jgi:hypothetical protein